MNDTFARTRLLLGEDAMKRLEEARVAVFGVGGVGGYVVEALARSGIGHLDLIDNDTVALSNLNRQIIATMNTLGRPKVDVMRERILSINPYAEVVVHECFFLPENADQFDFGQYSYVVDAVDTVTAKLEIVQRAQAAGTPVISSMGTGNKLDPSRFRVADIYQTSVDPLARVMRRELKKRGVKSLKVVYSTEEPLKPEASGKIAAPVPGGSSRRSTPGSTAFVPPAAGLLIASEVVKDLIRCVR
ncbi:MAG: tRNA threonylcarbamoyladenosine dehydratase [Lachnospiraceae bacterium]|nr:tRNA threonylcarbamoyladenosine dehydratase [Lachnospiraceae bacterium]